MARQEPKKLMFIRRMTEYFVALFFTSFNVAHWVFVMRYWSLAIQLQVIVGHIKSNYATHYV